jgi:hypothetical protein
MVSDDAESGRCYKFSVPVLLDSLEKSEFDPNH